MPKISSNILKNKSLLQCALATIPSPFQDKIIKAYLELKNRYKESRFESSGLAAGKYCESILRMLQDVLNHKYTPFGQQIQNFADECRILIQLPKTVGVESQRILLPRALVFLYTLRNKRGIGHIGGDIDANPIDAATIVRIADWIMCELIRIHHNLSLEDAQALINVLSTRDIPSIWEIDGKKRILKEGLDYKQQVLLFAYQDLQSGILVEDLLTWTEYSNSATFRKSVLKPLHDRRLIEYNQEDNIVYLSPLGINEVEENILKM